MILRRCMHTVQGRFEKVMPVSVDIIISFTGKIEPFSYHENSLEIVWKNVKIGFPLFWTFPNYGNDLEIVWKWFDLSNVCIHVQLGEY